MSSDPSVVERHFCNIPDKRNTITVRYYPQKCLAGGVFFFNKSWIPKVNAHSWCLCILCSIFTQALRI